MKFIEFSVVFLDDLFPIRYRCSPNIFIAVDQLQHIGCRIHAAVGIGFTVFEPLALCAEHAYVVLIFLFSLPLSQPIQIRTTATIFSIAGLLLQESRFFQVLDSTSGGGFGKLQVPCNGGDGWPADPLFVCPVGKVDVDSYRPVGQILFVKMGQILHHFPKLPSFFVT